MDAVETYVWHPLMIVIWGSIGSITSIAFCRLYRIMKHEMRGYIAEFFVTNDNDIDINAVKVTGVTRFASTPTLNAVRCKAK